MSLSWKITTISSRIDLRTIEPVHVSNGLIFRPLYNGRTFYAAQRFNQFNFGHYKQKWDIDVDKCSYTLYSSFYVHVYYYQRRKKPVSHSIVSDSEASLASKWVSLHNLHIRTLLMFKFHR